MDTEKAPPPRNESADRISTRVVAVAINPYRVHVYWKISEGELKDILQALLHDARPILRIYDITCILFDGTNAHQIFDVEVDLRTGKWDVPLWAPDKSYLIDLGYQAADGRFCPVARSNVVNLPRAEPSTRIAEHYLRVERGRIRSLVPMIIPDGPHKKPVESVRPNARNGMGRDAEIPFKGEMQRVKAKDSARATSTSKGPASVPCPVPKPGIPAEQTSVYKGAYPMDMVRLTQEKFSLGVSSPAQGKDL